MIHRFLFAATLGLAALASGTAHAQGSAPASTSTVPPLAQTADGKMMLTVFMRHDQSKNLKEINETIQKNGYFEQFPPEGVEVVSWYVVMGIGQVVTLRFPPEKLRAINVVLENTAWGPYRTDFYPTYDYKDLAEQQKRMMSRPKQP